MSTPLSHSSSYCTPARFLVFKDARQVGDLVRDKDQRVEGADLLADANVQGALDAASGDVEMACLVAGRYTPTDLAGLTGVSAVALERLVAELALWHLTTRRYPAAEMPAAVALAYQTLEKLERGDLIFGIREVMDAANPTTEFVDQRQIDTLGLSTSQAQRFFGARTKERRLGR